MPRWQCSNPDCRVVHPEDRPWAPDQCTCGAWAWERLTAAAAPPASESSEEDVPLPLAPYEWGPHMDVWSGIWSVTSSRDSIYSTLDRVITSARDFRSLLCASKQIHRGFSLLAAYRPPPPTPLILSCTKPQTPVIVSGAKPPTPGAVPVGEAEYVFLGPSGEHPYGANVVVPGVSGCAAIKLFGYDEARRQTVAVAFHSDAKRVDDGDKKSSLTCAGEIGARLANHSPNLAFVVVVMITNQGFAIAGHQEIVHHIRSKMKEKGRKCDFSVENYYLPPLGNAPNRDIDVTGNLTTLRQRYGGDRVDADQVARLEKLRSHLPNQYLLPMVKSTEFFKRRAGTRVPNPDRVTIYNGAEVRKMTKVQADQYETDLKNALKKALEDNLLSGDRKAFVETLFPKKSGWFW